VRLQSSMQFLFTSGPANGDDLTSHSVYLGMHLYSRVVPPSDVMFMIFR